MEDLQFVLVLVGVCFVGYWWYELKRKFIRSANKKTEDLYKTYRHKKESQQEKTNQTDKRTKL